MSQEKTAVTSNVQVQGISLSTKRLSNAAFQILDDAKVSGKPSIGLELEFFLRDKENDSLCSLKQSQDFLRSLANLPNWKVFSTNQEHSTILKVSKNIDSKRYHSVKYEHPPHMMEVALSYETDLYSLRNSLVTTLSELHTAAKLASVIIDISPKSEPLPVDWEVVERIENRFKPLSDSRHKIFADHTSAVPDHRIDFTTFTAATQFHIGGIKWWNLSPDFIDRLYRAEFLISGLAYNRLISNFQDRWAPYRYVFGKMPLLGFPLLNKWTTEEWLGALLHAPCNEPGFNTFLDRLPTLDDETLRIEITKVRDLQIIKPKWIGTLEYRSDPAIADVDLMIKLAALRFGIYIYYSKKKTDPILSELTLSELSNQWWNGSHLCLYQQELAKLEETCHVALSARGLGEEKLI